MADLLKPIKLDDLTDEAYSSLSTGDDPNFGGPLSGVTAAGEAPLVPPSSDVRSLPGQTNVESRVNGGNTPVLDVTEAPKGLDPLSVKLRLIDDERKYQRSVRQEERAFRLLESIDSFNRANAEWDRRHAIEIRDRNSRRPVYIRGSGTGKLMDAQATRLSEDPTRDGGGPLDRTEPYENSSPSGFGQAAPAGNTFYIGQYTAPDRNRSKIDIEDNKNTGGIFISFEKEGLRRFSRSGKPEVNGMKYDEFKDRARKSSSITGP